MVRAYSGSATEHTVACRRVGLEPRLQSSHSTCRMSFCSKAWRMCGTVAKVRHAVLRDWRSGGRVTGVWLWAITDYSSTTSDVADYFAWDMHMARTMIEDTGSSHK